MSNKLLTGLMPQETFPYEDLNRDNAELLALLLSNQDILNSSHTQAEASVFLYRISHRTLRAISVQLAQGSRARAFDHGIVAYEVVSAMVRPNTPECNVLVVGEKAMEVAVADQNNLIGYIQDAEENFTAQHPNTRQVIRDSAERFHPLLASYAISGAAFAYQFELEANAA